MRSAPELILALITVLVAGGLLWILDGPRTEPGALVGHSLGILGFGLMVVTELAYSIRKRVPNRAWGPMRIWLRVHIFTGIVGPFLVLLHTGWQFAGLAGWAMLATATVVASGFVGRYLYTALPRAADGMELSLADLDARIAAAERRMAEAPGEAARTRSEWERLRARAATAGRMRRLLSLWHTVHVPLGVAMFVLVIVHVGAVLYFAARLR